jgi:cyclophilin family peptidyl-prolyl cis-trans isomerase
VLSFAAVRSITLLSAATVVLALAGCGGSTPPDVVKTTGPRAAGAVCRTVPVPKPKGPQHLSAPTLRLDPAKTYTVTVSTNCGPFAFTLDVKQSPKTAASVYSLVKRGFYDGLTFQRVVPGFVIQGGDPTGTGAGGSGYTVVEPPPRSTQYLAGDVAMAKTSVQPSGASGSQFFVVAGANISASAGLTPDYALVGKVVSGMGVVQAIDRLPVAAGSGYPTPAVVMSKVTVSTS